MNKDTLLEWLDKATVLELNDVVKAIEEKFGVSAQAVAAAPAGGGQEKFGVSAATVAAPAGGGQASEAKEEKDSFIVTLASAGEGKIAVMKVVKEVLGVGLKEAKDLVDGAPSTLKEGMKKAEAEDLKKKIEEAGGKVELK